MAGIVNRSLTKRCSLAIVDCSVVLLTQLRSWVSDGSLAPRLPLTVDPGHLDEYLVEGVMHRLHVPLRLFSRAPRDASEDRQQTVDCFVDLRPSSNQFGTVHVADNTAHVRGRFVQARHCHPLPAHRL